MEAENFTKLADIKRITAICGLSLSLSFSFSLSALVMTNFQFCRNILDSGMLTRRSVLSHAVSKAPQRHNCQELHWAEENGTTLVMCFGEWLRVRAGMFLALINTPNSPAN